MPNQISTLRQQQRKPGALHLQIEFGTAEEVTQVVLASNVLKHFTVKGPSSDRPLCASMAQKVRGEQGGTTSWQLGDSRNCEAPQDIQKSIQCLSDHQGPPTPGHTCQQPPDHWPGPPLGAEQVQGPLKACTSEMQAKPHLPTVAWLAFPPAWTWPPSSRTGS